MGVESKGYQEINLHLCDCFCLIHCLIHDLMFPLFDMNRHDCCLYLHYDCSERRGEFKHASHYFIDYDQVT